MVLSVLRLLNLTSILELSFFLEKSNFHYFETFSLGGKKASPTSFFLVTSTNIGTVLQNFLTYSCNPFRCKTSRLYLVPVPNIEDHPSKKRFLRSDPYKSEVMITSLIDMLELPNLCHMTRSTM